MSNPVVSDMQPLIKVRHEEPPVQNEQVRASEGVGQGVVGTTGHSSGRYIYSVFHTIMSLVAIYLTFRCNKGFQLGPFLVACCCPYLYIVYILATRGTCGVIENESRL